MAAKALDSSARSLPEVEVQILRSELTSGEWTLRDARYHGFVLQAGSARTNGRYWRAASTSSARRCG